MSQETAPQELPPADGRWWQTTGEVTFYCLQCRLSQATPRAVQWAASRWVALATCPECGSAITEQVSEERVQAWGEEHGPWLGESRIESPTGVN